MNIELPRATAETSGRYDRRNASINIFEGGLWVAGASLISAQTVLPALVTRLGGGNIAVGAVGMIVWFAFFMPQVFVSRYGQTLERKKPWVVRFGFAQRFMVLTLGLIVLLLGDVHPGAALALFFVAYPLNQLLTGITAPVWFDFYTKLTPLRRRGRVTGIRSAVAGLFAFGGGLLLTLFLSAVHFPLSYALVFFVAFVLQCSSVILQTRLVEEYPSRVMPQQSLEQYARQLEDVVQGKASFRNLIVAAIFLILAAMPMSFFTVYALHRFQVGEGIVGSFTLTMVAGQIVGSLLNGFLADRYGNRLALLSAAGAMLAATLTASVAQSIEWYIGAFFFAGMNMGSELMVRQNLVVELSPVEQRSTYIGLMNTLLAPLYLFGLAGGWLSDQLGYHAVFLVGIACSVTGILMLLKRVQEPRRAIAPEAAAHV